MTWTQWCSSLYNSGGYSVASASAKIPSRIVRSSYEPNAGVGVDNNTLVSPTDTIIGNTAYVIATYSAGVVII